MAYLACPIGHAHPRDKLAALLWSGMGEAQARGSLRQAIRAIRKAVGRSEPLVLAGETVALDARVVAVDAAELDAQATAGTPAALERVAAIYAGDLLAGPDLQEGPFDEWLLAERERLRGRALYASTASSPSSKPRAPSSGPPTRPPGSSASTLFRNPCTAP